MYGNSLLSLSSTRGNLSWESPITVSTLSSVTPTLVTPVSTSSTATAWSSSDRFLPCLPVEALFPLTYVFKNPDALSVDCASHTVQPISDIPQRMLRKILI
ncbi:LOW QUALITY PROTEIN: hypothetical protein HID58_056557 [Brassica napus]|uniref:Uncharacterized protein n=1 Tax=Brassica napus TaxID=3708 RepID=A0ABQ8APK8_BRANA|nr:LOW QUALITY PROTEIN: hypothetical protein HID58_056557 [Brassica napus]